MRANQCFATVQKTLAYGNGQRGARVLAVDVPGLEHLGVKGYCGSPFTRSVSLTPGIMNRMPISGLHSTLVRESSRLFPGQSGMSRVEASTTWTKPALSPRGVTSVPDADAEPRHKNGESAMNLRMCSSSSERTLRAARGDTAGYAERSDAVSPIDAVYCEWSPRPDCGPFRSARANSSAPADAEKTE